MCGWWRRKVAIVADGRDRRAEGVAGIGPGPGRGLGPLGGARCDEVGVIQRLDQRGDVLGLPARDAQGFMVCGEARGEVRKPRQSIAIAVGYSRDRASGDPVAREPR